MRQAQARPLPMQIVMCWRAISLLLLWCPLAWAGTLDIVVVSDGFTDMAEFHTKAEKSRVLLASLEPFKSRPQDWTWREVENTTPLGCHESITRLLLCDLAKAKAVAGAADRIIVLSKGHGNKGSGGNPAVCSTGTYGWRVCVHEFAHLLGNLHDEYVLYTTGAAAERMLTNCWAGVAPPDTRPWRSGCTYGNWWRLEPCTLMRKVDIGSCAYFGELSVVALNKALDYWVGQP